MSKRGFGVVLVFLVGCAVGGGAGQFVVPKATAQQVAKAQRWEYYCEDLYWDDWPDFMRATGENGWELVNFQRTGKTSFCFKRPKM